MAINLSFENKRKPRKGRVLIADPFSKDEYFGRSVVYLCDHNSEGTFGFVLTNYLDLNLAEVAKNFPNISANISIGGRSEEHTSELQSRPHLVCRLLLEKKK